MRYIRIDRAVHFFLRFAHAHAADGVTIEIHRHQRLRRIPGADAENRFLHNAEKRLLRGGPRFAVGDEMAVMIGRRTRPQAKVRFTAAATVAFLRRPGADIRQRP